MRVGRAIPYTLSMKLFMRHMLPGLWLIAAIPMSALILAALNTVFNTDGEPEDAILAVGFILGHLLTGYLWSHTLLRRVGLPASKLANLIAGIGYALTVVSIHHSFGLFDRLIILLAVKGTIHLEFGVIFVTWTGIVAGGTGLALGIGLKAWRLALKMLVSGFLTGAGVFLMTAYVMDRLGFRVGVPRTDGIPNMPVVTLLGIWLVALAGTGVFSLILAKNRLTVSTHSGPAAEDFPVNDPIIISEFSFPE